jgi:hypothetical protein
LSTQCHDNRDHDRRYQEHSFIFRFRYSLSVNVKGYLKIQEYGNVFELKGAFFGLVQIFLIAEKPILFKGKLIPSRNNGQSIGFLGFRANKQVL